MAKIKTAQRKIERLERELVQARIDYLQAISDAHEGGMSQASIARELQVTRQRVRQLLDRGLRDIE